MIYVANTLTAFLVMNLMSKRIQIQNINKIQNWNRNDSHSICWISINYRLVDGMAIYGHSWVFMGIFVLLEENFHLMEKQSKININSNF